MDAALYSIRSRKYWDVLRRHLILPLVSILTAVSPLALLSLALRALFILSLAPPLFSLSLYLLFFRCYSLAGSSVASLLLSVSVSDSGCSIYRCISSILSLSNLIYAASRSFLAGSPRFLVAGSPLVLLSVAGKEVVKPRAGS